MQKVLIIQTAFIGDVILATPVIEQVRAAWPDAAIDFLLRKGNESLFKGHPELRKVIVRNKKEGKWQSLRKVLKEVRNEKYDLVINLHRFLSSGIIAGFSKGKHICGFDKNPFSWRYHYKIPHVIAEPGEAIVHETERNRQVAAHLTGNLPAPMRLYPSAEDYDRVRESRPYVCIAPTSVWFTKQWPADRWVRLIDRMPGNCRVFLLGAPGDRAACEALTAAAAHADVQVRAGELSLLQSAALMAGARMNYVNDSAPLHLASAMDAPVTAVFLSTVPRNRKFGSFGMSSGGTFSLTM